MKTHSILFFLLLSFFTTSCVSGDSDTYVVENYVEVGSKVPSFSVSSSAGNVFSSDAFVGKRSLLVLFSTSCSDCRRVLPVIEEIWQAVKNETDCQVVAIARAETVDRWGVIPCYCDPDRSVFSLFANSTVPRLYIINEAGIVTWMAIEQLELTADELLNQLSANK